MWSGGAAWSQEGFGGGASSGGSSSGGSSGTGGSGSGTGGFGTSGTGAGSDSGAGGASAFGGNSGGNGTGNGNSNGNSGSNNSSGSGKKSGTGGTGSNSGNGSGNNGSNTGAGSGGSGSSGSPFGQPGSGSPFGNPFGNPFGTPGSSSFGSPSDSSGSPFGTGASSAFGSSGVTPYNPSGTGTGNGTTQPQGGNANGNTPGNGTEGTNGTGTGNGTTPKPQQPENTLPANLFQAPGLSNGSASSFGATPGSGVKPTAQSFNTFTLPAAYGGASQTFVTGQGRFSRPHFVYLASMQIGFDDNVLQTPTNQEAPAPVLVQAATPSTTQTFLVPNEPGPTPSKVPIVGRPHTPPPGFHEETVTTPGQKAVFQDVPFTPQKRIESFLMRATVGADLQFASRKTLFTMDARLSSDYYLSKPGRKVDPNANIGFNFIHRYTPRLQFSATASVAYTTQPDVASVNTPTQGSNAYTTASAKMDLSYRWSKRFTTVSSLSAIGFEQENNQAAQSLQTIFGTEARYLWSPRLTLTGEVRYAVLQYMNDPARDSNNLYLLGGVDLILSNRFTSTVRLGESIDSFKSGGNQASTPYAEITVNWRFSPTGLVSWNTRYGFEDPPDANSTLLTLRTGITVLKSLSSRLRVTAGVNYADSRTSSKLLTPASSSSSTTDSNQIQVTNNYTQTTFSFSTGVEYLLTPRVTLNASWTFTDFFSSTKVSDYYRNQIFFGADYSF